MPIHRNLAEMLESMPRESVMLITNTRGRAWKGDGFRSSWSQQMDCLDLLSGDCHDLQFHGLRKSAVCMLLHAGCTTADVSAITGQSQQMVEHYAHQMQRHNLAASAMVKWENVSVLELQSA